jgi:hypothetical protein
MKLNFNQTLKGEKMKKLLIVGAVVGLLSACGTTQPYSNYQMAQSGPTVAQQQSAIDKAPEWMFKLPKAPGVVFENGTATSNDFAMADMKAKTIAYSKICTAAGGKVRSQTKVYSKDDGTNTTEQSEMAIRNICPDINISGVETVEMKHVAEGNRIRTYVLVALSASARNNQDTKRSAKEAFKELDEITGNAPVGTDTTVTPLKGDSVKVANPDGTTSTLNMLPVDNAEYKAKRDAALQKPGAMIGHTSVE